MSASGWPPLGDGEILLDGADELLWRICAEAHWDMEMKQPSAQMFRPTGEDNGKLSTSRGSKATPKEAIERCSMPECAVCGDTGYRWSDSYIGWLKCKCGAADE